MTRPRILSLYVIVLGVLAGATYLVLLETGLAREFIENAVARVLVRDRFRIDGASVDISDGTVHIDGLHVDAGQRQRLAVRQVEVDVDTNPLGGLGDVERVRLVGGELDLDFSSGQTPDLAALLARSDSPSGADGQRVPPIDLIDWHVSLRFGADAVPVELDDVDLWLRPSQQGAEELVLGGEIKTPHGLAGRVSGICDPSRGILRAVVEVDDVPITSRLAAPYSQLVVDFAARAGISGVARHLALWTEIDGDGARAGATLQLEDVHCKVPELPYPLLGATGTVAVSADDDGTVEFDATHDGADGKLHARGIVTRCFTSSPRADVAIRLDGQRIPAVEELMLANPDLARVWRALEPSSGVADGEIRLHTREADGQLDAELDLELAGVNATFHGFPAADGGALGFPHPIEQLAGTVQLRGDAVHLRGLRGKLSGGDVGIDGTILLQTADRDERVRLRVSGAGAELTDELRAALAVLSPDAAAIWADYSPSGRADFSVTVDNLDLGGDPAVAVDLRPLGCRARYAGFPCALELVTGEISIRGDLVELELSALRGTSTVELVGRFRTGVGRAAEAEALASELWLSARDVELDGELRAALITLAPSLGEVWDAVRPGGKGHVELATWRVGDDTPASFDLRLDLLGARVELEQFQLPIEDLTGAVFVHGDAGVTAVELDAVRGAARNSTATPADVVLHGTAVDDGTLTVDLTASVERLQLCDRLADVLARAGAVDLDTWRLLAPAGFVDLVGLFRGAVDRELSHRLHIELRDVSSAASFLPDRASELRGEVVVVDGRVELGPIRGKIGEAEVYCSRGSVVHTGTASEITAVVESPVFPVDDRIARLLSGPLRDTFLAAEVRGAVEVQELALRFRFPDDGTPFSASFAGVVDTHDLALTLGTRLQDARGRWTITDARLGDGTGIVRGRVDRGACSLLGHRVDELDADFTADPDRFALHGVSFRLHNGRVRGSGDAADDVVYDLRPPGNLSCSLEWESIDLRDFLGATDLRSNDYAGNIAGEFRLRQLPGGRLIDAVGDGALRITEGRLGEVPIFTAIYRNFAARRRPQFESASFRFQIEDRLIRVDDLQLGSTLLDATGAGTVTMDGYADLRLDFPDLIGTDADWLVVPLLLRELFNSVVQFQVFGYLRSPQAKPLTLLGEPAVRQPLGPIPPRRDHRE